MKVPSRPRMALVQAVAVLVAAAALAGCGSGSSGKPGRIRKIEGDEQCVSLALPAAERVAGRPLRVEVLCAQSRGWLCTGDTSSPTGGAEVLFRIAGRDHGAVLRSCAGGAPVEVGRELRVRTDPGGGAAVSLQAGNEPGDITVEVSLPGHPYAPGAGAGAGSGVRPVFFRVSAGVFREGEGQEAGAGSSLANPLVLALTGPDGRPVAGVPVDWHIEKGPPGTRFTLCDGRTDAEGRARAQVELGDGTGQVVVAAVAADAERGIAFLPVRYHLFSLGYTGILITVIGGLAIFILGMKMMSDGLARVAGARMKAILQAFTRNTVVGVGVGAAVTAVIQSSSATTVMVVGFVNAGLLSLERAIGLIMGANIGTTITAQMIAFKLERVALPAVALGVALHLLARRKTTQNWGMVLAGFGVLFTGLVTMSGVLNGLQHSATVTGFFSSIDCAPQDGRGGMPVLEPLLAIGIGALVTLVVQSSSAAIGLLQVLVLTGLVNFYTAIPLMLGCDIGTTTTALFAVIGANRNARRAAVAHMLFNVLGTAIMYGLFYIQWHGRPVFLELVNSLTGGDAFAGENLSRQVANANTLFKVVFTAVFLPLVPALAWMCRKLVPESKAEKEEAPRYLEPHLLHTPALALERARSELAYMTGLARKAVVESFRSFLDGRMPNHEVSERRESRIDDLQHEITGYLVKLSERTLIEEESRQLPLLIHAVNDAERIGDHAENIVELAERRAERALPLTEEALGELRELFGEVDSMFRHVLALLEQSDRSAVERALHCEERINSLSRELNHNHVHRLETGGCSMVSGVVFLDMVANIEKVGDHLTNIAQAGKGLLGEPDEG